MTLYMSVDVRVWLLLIGTVLQTHSTFVNLHFYTTPCNVHFIYVLYIPKRVIFTNLFLNVQACYLTMQL